VWLSNLLKPYQRLHNYACFQMPSNDDSTWQNINLFQETFFKQSKVTKWNNFSLKKNFVDETKTKCIQWQHCWNYFKACAPLRFFCMILKAKGKKWGFMIIHKWWDNLWIVLNVCNIVIMLQCHNKSVQNLKCYFFEWFSCTPPS
jgi:hypothetical protein